MMKNPIHRRWHHNDLTFGLLYAFSENFILPLSHDEVVHGKGSLVSKMAGDDWQKFATLRAYYGFMWTQPGKKLLFMGGEFAQWREWDNDTSLDWHLLEYEPHRGMQALVRDLNCLYRNTPALYQFDSEWTGFEWIEPNDIENSIISYLRKGKEGTKPVLALGNFTPVPRYDYRVGVPFGGFWEEKLNTDSAIYGGANIGNAGGVMAEKIESHGQPFSLVLTIPPLATIALQPTTVPAVVKESALDNVLDLIPIKTKALEEQSPTPAIKGLQKDESNEVLF
jgi:1,4-alpha-glucan branching enzyme